MEDLCDFTISPLCTNYSNDSLISTTRAWLDQQAVNGTPGDSASPTHIQAITTLSLVVLLLYLLTFIFGTVGNTLTIGVILRNKKLRTVATCFMLNLAIADDLYMLSLPFMAYSSYAKNWVFGPGMCKVMCALRGMNQYASIFTMVVMSLDRYLAVVHPLRSMQYRTITNAALVCVMVWAVCAVIMTPYWLFATTQTKQIGIVAKTTCRLYWPEETSMEHEWFWANFELLVSFVSPIVIMLVCYLLLVRHLIVNTRPVQDLARKPIKKVTLMVFIVTLVFILCWTPYHIITYQSIEKTRRYANSARPSSNEIVFYAIFNTVAKALVFISSCCNPIIYSLSSRNFRRHYVAALSTCCRQARTRSSSIIHRTTSWAPKFRDKLPVFVSNLIDETTGLAETERVSAYDRVQETSLTALPPSPTEKAVEVEMAAVRPE